MSEKEPFDDATARSDPSMATKLVGKAAIVTGGATGIGRAIVLRLVRSGARVTFNYSRSQHEAEETIAAAAAFPGAASPRAVRADLADLGATRAFVRDAAKDLGRLDLLVNNAGVSPPVPSGDLDAIPDAIWDTVLAVNVRAPFACAQAAAPFLRASRGAIVNVGSVAGVSGEGSSLPYAVSKSAMHGLSKALARALAPEVRVSCVVPGFVRTRWWDGREDVGARMRRRALLDEEISPDDVAELVCQVGVQRGLTGHLIVLDAGSIA